jgi:O-antigen ligase
MLTRVSYAIPLMILISGLYGFLAIYLVESSTPWLGTLLALTIPISIYALPIAAEHAIESVRATFRHVEWWKWGWLLIALSGLVFRVRAAQSIQDTPLDGWALYRIGLMALVASMLFARQALGATPWLRSLFQGLIGCLAAYSLIALLSTTWSVYPAWTFYKSAEYFVDVALLAAIVAETKTTEQFKSLFDLTWLFCFCLLLSVWLGIVTQPANAVARGIGTLGYQIQGVVPALSANDVGELSAVISVVALCRLLRYVGQRRAFYSTVLVIGLITLAFSQTRSATVGFAVGAVTVLVTLRRYKLLAIVGGACLLIVTTSAVTSFVEFFRRGQNEGLFLSFSGRTYWWTYGWNKFLESPLAGYGAYAGGRFAALANISGSTSSLHNTYLELLLGAGIWTLIPMLLTLAGAWRSLIGTVARYVRGIGELQLLAEAMGILAIVTVRSMFSSAMIWHPELAFLLSVGLAELLRRRRTELA